MPSLTKPKNEEFTQTEIEALAEQAGVSLDQAVATLVDDGDTHTFTLGVPASSTAKDTE